MHGEACADTVEPAADVKPLFREVALKLDRHGDSVVICYLGLGLIAVGIDKVGVRRLAFNGNYLAEIDVCSVLKGRSADLYRVGCADLSLIAEKLNSDGARLGFSCFLSRGERLGCEKYCGRDNYKDYQQVDNVDFPKSFPFCRSLFQYLSRLFICFKHVECQLAQVKLLAYLL